jgi:acyl dehydratase
MIDRSRIGFETAATTVDIDAWRVKLFCQAIGEDDAIYHDPEAAHAAGHPACPVPPTFLKAVEGDHFSSAQLLALLEVPLRGVLHAEQSFDHLEPVYVGDRLEVSRKVAGMQDKKNGAFTFITVDTRYRRAGQDVASSRQTILVRHALEAAR